MLGAAEPYRDRGESHWPPQCQPTSENWGVPVRMLKLEHRAPRAGVEQKPRSSHWADEEAAGVATTETTVATAESSLGGFEPLHLPVTPRHKNPAVC